MLKVLPLLLLCKIYKKYFLNKKDCTKTKREIDEEQKLKDQRARRDQALLNTFVSISDIETGRSDKIVVIESDNSFISAKQGQHVNSATNTDINLFKGLIDKQYRVC